MPSQNSNGWVAIRRSLDTGNEFVSSSTFDFTHDSCRLNANMIDVAIPVWASANPVIRIAKAVVKEVEKWDDE